MKKPERIGPYTLLAPLGDGAHSNVWLASAGSGSEKVVLKLARADDAAGRERLLHESALAIGFDHPNIVRIHECGGARGITWIAMGYVPGPHQPLTLANFRQLLLALVHVHAHGVVHADIRCGNLLLDEEGDLRLAGFGLARRIGELPPAPASVAQVVSPEQLRGKAIDTRSDLFGAGVVLYQVLTGKRPFDGTPLEIMQQILHDTQPAPSRVAPGLGTSFDDVVRRSLARERDDRYASAFAFLSDFDAACRRGVRISA
jgi:serine/threonine protein kinase